MPDGFNLFVKYFPYQRARKTTSLCFPTCKLVKRRHSPENKWKTIGRKSKTKRVQVHFHKQIALFRSSTTRIFGIFLEYDGAAPPEKNVCDASWGGETNKMR